jgi:type IV secretory pathway VirB10-like protein
MAKNILGTLRATKTRTLIILGFIFAFILSLILYFIFKSPQTTELEKSKSTKPPQITAIPGGVTTERYQELLEEENRKRAEAAKKAGTSAVATIIGARKKEGSETFGIEGELLKAAGECKCPPVGGPITELDPVMAARLMSELEANPDRALELLTKNPGLAKAVCNQKPDLALKLAEQNKDVAKIFLKECPAFAKLLAEKDPALFKQLMLENPELAAQLAKANPDLFKQLMESDPDFAKKLLLSNPEIAKQFATSDPELIKKLMESDPDFAKRFAQANPDIVKTLMKNDPDFADKMGQLYPDMVKSLMKGDPEFARALAKSNPKLVKDLMLKDPEFAKAMAAQNPDMVKALMANDPQFARALADANPTLVKELMKNDPEFAKLMAKQNPDMVKKLMLDDPEFAKIMARNNPQMVAELMKNDPAFAKKLEELNPGITALVRSQLGAPPPGQTAQERADAERRKMEEEQAAAARLAQLSEARRKQLEELEARMEAQSKSIFQAWNEYTPQVFVKGEWKKETVVETGGPISAASITQGGDGVMVGKVAPGPLFKAGDVIYGVMDTSVNSDEPGPVLATVIEGPYRGAKVLGTITATPQPGGQPPEKVTLNFSSINIPTRPASVPISAVAIDPETARTALATDVDHHYLLRYGTLFASSFLTGYAKVITSMGTTQTTAQNGLATTTITPQVSTRQQLFAALGQVGTAWGQATSSYFNIPPTITVEAGTGIGILFLADVNG